MAEVRPREIDGGIVLPGEAGEGEVDGSHRAAARGGREGVGALGEGQRAEGLGGRRGNTAGVADGAPSQGDRDRIADPVVVLRLEPAIVAQRERGVIDVDGRGAQQRRVVLEGRHRAKQGGGASIGLRGLQRNIRVAAGLDEIQPCAGDRPRPSGVSGSDDEHASGARDGSTGTWQRPRRADTIGQILDVSVEVDGASDVHIEQGA